MQTSPGEASEIEETHYPATEPFVVNRRHIRDFAAAAGVDHPACLDVEAARELGYRDLVAPPTYAVAITLEATRQVSQDPRLGIDYSRVVHGGQSFEFSRPLVAGDTVVAQVQLEKTWTKGPIRFVTTRTDLSTHDGLVATAWSTLAERLNNAAT